MTNINIPPSNDPQRDYLAQLQAEAHILPEAERADHETLVSELAGELALSESMQLQADEYIARAKRLVMDGGETVPAERRVLVDMSKVGWLTGEDEESILAQEVSTPELDYLFVDLTGKHRVTQKLRQELAKQGVNDKLTEKVTTEGIPTLWNGIVSGRNRSDNISIGQRSSRKIKASHSLNTSYSAYKIDAQGTNNRAIIMFLGRESSNKPIIALAALYDHKGQADVYKSLFLKTLKQKRQ